MIRNRNKYKYDENNTYYGTTSAFDTYILGLPVWVLCLIAFLTLTSFIGYLIIKEKISEDNYLEQIIKSENAEKVEYSCMHYPELFKYGACEKLIEKMRSEKWK